MVTPSYEWRLALHAMDLDASGHDSAAGTDFRWFNVEDYGAVHDGSTDDTTAVQDAIDACLAAGGGIVYFPLNTDGTQAVYAINGALRDTGTFNSQLEFGQQSAFTVVIMLGPATLRSNWSGTISGNPAVISAGTHDSVTLNPLFVRWIHMRVECPVDPKLTAIDMTKAATCRWDDLSIAVNGSVTAVPTHSNAIGLDLPWGLNDQNSGGSEVNIGGFYTGLRPSEQMAADAVYVQFNARGLELRGSQGSPNNLAHSVWIGRLNSWFNVRGIIATGDERSIQIDLMDAEHNDPAPFATVYDVDDSSNYLRGFIHLHTTDYSSGTATDDALINGATGLSFHFDHPKRWLLSNAVDVPTGTNPSTNPANGRRLYTDSSSGDLTGRKSDGTTYDYEKMGGMVGLSGTPSTGQVPTATSSTTATWQTPSGTGIGPILISDTPSTPLVFADLIQNEAQDDLVYADT